MTNDELVEKLKHFYFGTPVKINVPILRDGDDTELDIISLDLREKDNIIIVEVD